MRKCRKCREVRTLGRDGLCHECYQRERDLIDALGEDGRGA